MTAVLVLSAVSLLLPIRALEPYIEAREEIAIVDAKHALGLQPSMGEVMASLRKQRSAMLSLLESTVPFGGLYLFMLIYQAVYWRRMHKQSRQTQPSDRTPLNQTG